jgi:hypothetical protein
MKDSVKIKSLTFTICALHSYAGTCFGSAGTSRPNIILITTWIPLPTNLSLAANAVVVGDLTPENKGYGKEWCPARCSESYKWLIVNKTFFQTVNKIYLIKLLIP